MSAFNKNCLNKKGECYFADSSTRSLAVIMPTNLLFLTTGNRLMCLSAIAAAVLWTLEPDRKDYKRMGTYRSKFGVHRFVGGYKVGKQVSFSENSKRLICAGDDDATYTLAYWLWLLFSSHKFLSASIFSSTISYHRFGAYNNTKIKNLERRMLKNGCTWTGSSWQQQHASHDR